MYINETRLGRALFFLPKLLAKALFVFLPFYPSKSTDKNVNYSSVSRILPLFLTCFVITFLFTYVMVALLTLMEGRFFSARDAGQAAGLVFFNFQDDWANAVLYAVVVPTYISLGIVIVSISRSFQNQLSSRKPDRSGMDQRTLDGTRPIRLPGMWQTGIIVSAVLLSSFWVSAGYQNGVYSLLTCASADACVDKGSVLLYWFLTEKNESITYNTAGMYYIMLNFSLMVLIIVGILFFYSSAFSVAGLMKHINEGLYDDVNVLYRDLRNYKFLFVYGKWLFLAFIINTHIWKVSHLGNVQNLDITIIAYGLIGSIILPIPNYIVQTTWNLRQRRLFLSGEIKERADSCVIFTRGWLMVAKNVANFFITLFFAVSVVSIISDLLGIESEFSVVEAIINLVKK